MSRQGWAMAVFSIGLAVLVAGCRAKPKNKKAARGTYSVKRQVEALEGQVSALRRERNQMTRRLEVMEGQLDRLSKHPWLSSVEEKTLEELPRPSERPTSLFDRRPPPAFPKPPPPVSSPSSSKKGPPASSKPPTPPPGGKKRRSALSRLARIIRPPKVRERSAAELLRLGRRHFEAGELAAAVEKLRLSIDRTSDGANVDEALVLIGRAELARGRPLVATASFRRLLETAPKSPRVPEALYHAGDAFHRLNDKVQALKQWKELEARYPSHPLASKARDAIRQMAAER